MGYTLYVKFYYKVYTEADKKEDMSLVPLFIYMYISSN